MQANRLAQFEQNEISLSVSLYKLSLCGLSALVRRIRVDKIHFYGKPMRHQTIIDNGMDDKLVIPPLSLSAHVCPSALLL